MNTRTATYITMGLVLLVGGISVGFKDRIANAISIDTPTTHIVLGLILLIAGIVWGIIYHLRTPRGYRHYAERFDWPFGMKGRIRMTNPGIVVSAFGAILLLAGLLAR
jgi:hypothetical protein